MYFTDIKKPTFHNQTLLSEEQTTGLRVFITTVIRGGNERDRTGFLYEIDWRNNTVKKRIPIPVDTRHPFWNARGGNRGGRGMCVHNGVLYVATAMSLLKFDSNLNQIGEITHSYFAGIHEIINDDDGIWITSTVHDLVVKIDFDGNILDEWWASESPVMQDYFGFSPRKLNLELDFPIEPFDSAYQQYCDEEVFHLNTVWKQNGHIYTLANKTNAFIQIRPTPERVIVHDNKLMSPHNGILTQDERIIINDTRHQVIRIYDFKTGQRLKSLATPIYNQSIRGSIQFARPGWQRGLAHITDSIYLVGTSPATLFEVDIDRNVIGQICPIETDLRHSSNGVLVTKDI